MKIRTGFVSNSSSTSFLIISKDELNRADFFKLMGISPDSPIADLFESFYESIVSNVETNVNFRDVDPNTPIEYWFRGKRGGGLPQHMRDKLTHARDRGLRAYFGMLSSESNMIESFFCTDSFEVENDEIYFNGLECVW
jgi:hypothetical protein